MRVAFLVAPEGVEQIELERPWQAVVYQGWQPRLVSTGSGEVQAFHHLDKADTFPVDDVVGAAGPDDYDALVLPGGVANPDALRMDEGAVDFVRGFLRTGRPVAAICHAAWTLVEADVVRDRTMTSWPSLATDLRNAGATWVDEEVRVCREAPGTLVTSRRPDDLDAFCATFVKEFGAAGGASAKGSPGP